MPVELKTLERAADPLIRWRELYGDEINLSDLRAAALELQRAMATIAIKPIPGVVMLDGGTWQERQGQALKIQRDNPRFQLMKARDELAQITDRLKEQTLSRSHIIDGREVWHDDTDTVVSTLQNIAQRSLELAGHDTSPTRIQRFINTALGREALSSAASMAPELVENEGMDHKEAIDHVFDGVRANNWETYLLLTLPSEAASGNQPLELTEREMLILAEERMQVEKFRNPDIDNVTLAKSIQEYMCVTGPEAGMWTLPRQGMGHDAYWREAVHLGMTQGLPDYQSWTERRLEDDIPPIDALQNLGQRDFLSYKPAYLVYANASRSHEAIENLRQATDNYVLMTRTGEGNTVAVRAKAQGLPDYLTLHQKGKHDTTIWTKGLDSEGIMVAIQSAGDRMVAKPEPHKAKAMLDRLEYEWKTTGSTDPEKLRELGQTIREALPEVARNLESPAAKGIDRNHHRLIRLAHLADHGTGTTIRQPLPLASAEGMGDDLTGTAKKPFGVLSFRPGDEENTSHVYLDHFTLDNDTIPDVRIDNVPDAQRNQVACETADRKGYARIGMTDLARRVVPGISAMEIFALKPKTAEPVKIGTYVDHTDYNPWHQTPAELAESQSYQAHEEVRAARDRHYRLDGNQQKICQAIATQVHGHDADPDDLMMVAKALHEHDSLLLPEGKGDLEVPKFLFNYCDKDDVTKAIAIRLADGNMEPVAKQAAIERVLQQPWSKGLENYESRLSEAQDRSMTLG